jgi:acetate---CoA ligase (ADP-forming)
LSTASRSPLPVTVTRSGSSSPSSGGAGVLRAHDIRPGVLTETESKRLLESLGVRTSRDQLATDVHAAVSAARQIGYPVVAKVVSRDITHKSDVGGVRTGLASDAEVAAAYHDILSSVRSRQPDASVDGILISEQAEPGVECYIGMVNDGVLPPIVMVGIGGIYLELLRDSASAVAPVTFSRARQMITELRGFPMLDGTRGRPRLAVDALAQMVAQVSMVIHALGGRLRELDVNPVIVGTSGAVAVDALIVVDHVS